jgi:hypothetical protein
VAAVVAEVGLTEADVDFVLAPPALLPALPPAGDAGLTADVPGLFTPGCVTGILPVSSVASEEFSL